MNDVEGFSHKRPPPHTVWTWNAVPPSKTDVLKAWSPAGTYYLIKVIITSLVDWFLTYAQYVSIIEKRK